MIRHVSIFLGTFIAGALIALAARASLFQPHAEQEPAAPRAEHSAMVTNPLTPAPANSASVAASPAARPATSQAHGDHAAKKDAPNEDTNRPVNTVCAICGMDVDPALPTAQYQGKTIAFGCRMCPPKFKADPDRYGPYYLRNEVIKR